MAERRAQALTLDRDLLRELLGQEELRELLDPAALADLELSLQALVEERQAKTADQVHDLLRRLGDLGPDEAGARTIGGRVEASLHLAELAASRRAVRARIAGEERWIAIEDVARYRDGVGVSAPPGVPQAFLAPVAGALDGLLARYARTHGPFLGSEPARRWGLPPGVVEDALHRLVGGRIPARRASSVRAARSASSAIRRCSGCCAGDPSPRSGGRWSPSIPSPWPGSCPRGRAWPRRRPRRGVPVLRSVAPRRWNAWRRSWTSSPACRSRRRSWSGTSSRHASPATSPGSSTSWAPWARSPGWGGGAWAATTAGWCCSGRAGSCCAPAARPTAWSGRRARSTSGCAPTSAAAAPASTASCSGHRRPGRTARRSTRSGTWSGPARSRTTPSRRCAPCAGSGRRRTTGRDPGA